MGLPQASCGRPAGGAYSTEKLAATLHLFCVLRHPEASFLCCRPQKKPCESKAFQCWVEDGTRTHDLLNHNQAF